RRAFRRVRFRPGELLRASGHAGPRRLREAGAAGGVAGTAPRLYGANAAAKDQALLDRAGAAEGDDAPGGPGQLTRAGPVPGSGSVIGFGLPLEQFLQMVQLFG